MVAGLAALAALGTTAAPASAASSKLLWATVNICDTEERPDTVGIRGSMPGSGVRAERMFMRFQLQYLAKDDTWRSVSAPGDKEFVPVGSGRFRQRQSGRNFTVRPPKSGAFTLRGVVTFEWRRDGKAVRRERLRTTAKRGPTAGADPSGFSAASCEVRA